MIRIALAFGLLALAGCQTGPASTAGECRIFHDPGRAVKGATRQDQRDIDVLWQEPGIGGCGWARPKA